MQKKASYLLLTGALLLLAALPSAQATELPPVPAPTNQQTITATPSPEVSVTIPDKPNADHTTRQEIEFVGRIAPQIVSAIVPCNISFRMDPGEGVTVPTNTPGEELALHKVINPENAQVVNNSIWPVRLSVTDLKTQVPQGETPITLVGSLNPGDNEVLLVLGEKEPDPQTGTHIFESEDKFLEQALLATDLNAPPPTPLPILDVGAKETKNLWVYGKAAAAENEYEFTVTVTLRIDWVRKASTP